MMKCPFCQFDNEDGAAFCEQCKSDLSVATPEPVAVEPEVLPEPAPPAIAAPGPNHAAVPEVAPVVLEAIPVVAREGSSLPLAAEVISPVAAPITPLPPGVSETHSPEMLEAAKMLAGANAAPMAKPSPAPAAPAAAPGPAAAPTAELAHGAQPRLLVLRGQKRNVEYPLYEGLNFIGRADDKPVDIDLEDQEPPDRVWCSRQHCCISFESGKLEIEDLNSANGTYVNRQRIYPGQKRELHVTDIIQIGNVQLRVIT